MKGASFFAALHDAAGGGYPGETVDALWNLVWKGVITNDTFHALRAFTRPPERRASASRSGASFRSRRVAPPSAEGRWSLIRDRAGVPVSPTEWSTATAQQLLSRYGVLTREVAGGRRDLRRLQRGLRRAQGDGRRRPDPPRLLRRRRRRDAVRAPRGARADALAPGAAGRRRSRRPRPPPIRPTRTARC